MRWIWAAAFLAACGFEPGRLAIDAGGGGDDDAGDASLEDQLWIVDTAADFGASGHSVNGLAVEDFGSLTQVGYTYGGLLMYGKQAEQLWASTTQTIDYAATAGVTPDGISLWGTEYLSTVGELDRAGVVTNDMFTIWFEGEVFLDANDVVSVTADSAGFVEMLLPTGKMQIESRVDGLKQLPPVAAAGWYQVRAGWGEGNTSGYFDFKRQPSGGTAVHFSRDRLRAPTSKIRGAMREVFYRQMFGGAELTNGASIAALEKTPLLGATTFTPSPLGAGGNDDWSARWYGQFYAAVPGTYTLRADSDDGNQLMLAGVTASDAWGRNLGDASSQSTVTADLAIGWHDVALDYNQVGGNRAAALVVLAAPETELVGAPIPKDRLRPVEPRRDRLVSQTRKGAAQNVPNNATGPVRSIDFVGLSGELVSAIDITIRIDTDHLDQLVFRIAPPGGTPVVISNHPTGANVTGFIHFHSTAVGLVGVPLDGSWSLQISDDTGGANVTSYNEVAITMHTRAGPGQVAVESTWISPVRDAGATPVHVVDVSWVERAAIASEVFVRGCVMADCSDDPPWGTAIGQNGTAEIATRYLQSKVVMHSDGVTESVFESLAITYRTE